MGILILEDCRTRSVENIHCIIDKKEDKKSYQSMIEEAIRADASRTGTSKQLIVKYLVENFSLDPEKSKHYIKAALKKGLETKHFKMAKESGKGANSYKLGETATKTKKPKESASPKKSESAKAPKKKSAKSTTEKSGDVVRKKAVPKASSKKKTVSESATTPKKAKTAVSKVKEASKPKKTPTKKIGKVAAAVPAKSKK